MKKAYVLALAAAAAFACSAALASSASALTSGFLASGADTGLEVLFTGSVSKTIKLYDLKEDAGVECTTANPLFHILWPEFWHIELLSATLSGCTLTSKALNTKFEEVANACTAFNAATPIDLPWLGLVTLSSGLFLSSIEAEGAGAPGYLVECTTILGLVDDSCTTEAGKTEITNTSTGIEQKFGTANTESTNGELAKCSLGGASAGAVEGATAAKTDEEGLQLAVSEG